MSAQKMAHCHFSAVTAGQGGQGLPSASAKSLGESEMGPSGETCSGWEGHTPLLPVLDQSTTSWDTPDLGSAAPSQPLALAKPG